MLLDFTRHLAGSSGLLLLKHAVRSLQTLVDYSDFQRLKRLAVGLPLAPLVARQPRFRYKYLSRYVAASFSRPQRLAAILHHYDFLELAVGTEFFEQIARSPVLWSEQRGASRFAISLSFPQLVGFEGELSLNLTADGVLLQVVSFVFVPGEVVGIAAKRVLLLSQVQGIHNPELYRQATKALQDITPAAVLVQAAYGLALALRIRHAAGVSSEEQLSRGAGSVFNYNDFWEQLGGERAANDLFRLAIPAPEKPIECIKSAHRARTLRKRHYKQALRHAVEQQCRALFGFSPAAGPG